MSAPCAGGGVPNILHQVSVPVIDNLSCQEMFNSSGHKKTIRDSFLCAGYKDGKKDSCEVSHSEYCISCIVPQIDSSVPQPVFTFTYRGVNARLA